MTEATTANVPAIAKSQTDFFLLDGSSSMIGENWFRSVAAIDAYVAQLQLENVSSYIKLQVFDSHDHELIQRDCQLQDWVPLAADPIGAYWGSTPLYDAIAVAMWKLRDIDPNRASLVILTDGEENASKFTDLEQCRAYCRWAEARGWQITFIGCDFANHKLAERLGLKPEQAIGVQKALLSDATEALARKRANYGRTGAPMHWTADEQQQFGGYLAPPSAQPTEA